MRFLTDRAANSEVNQVMRCPSHVPSITHRQMLDLNIKYVRRQGHGRYWVIVFNNGLRFFAPAL